MYVSICVQVAAEARRGIPWSCSYRKSGATQQKFWQQNSCSLQKQQALLTTEMCLKLALIRSKTYQKIDVYPVFLIHLRLVIYSEIHLFIALILSSFSNQAGSSSWLRWRRIINTLRLYEAL